MIDSREDALPVSGGQGLRSLLSQDRLFGQLARYGVLTLVSACVTVGLPILLHEFGHLTPPHAAAIAFVTAFFVNFFSLRRLVFRSGRGARRDLGTYILSSLVFRSAEYAAFLALDAAGVYYIVALLIVLTVSAITKFLWYRRVMHAR